jgi:hypothetical protein
VRGAVDRHANPVFRGADVVHPQLWKKRSALMSRARREPTADPLRTFCEDAARQMVNLETRLRTLIAATAQVPESALIEEAIAPSLQLAKTLLDAGRHGRHGTLLAVRPLLRALTTAPR